MFEVSQLSVRYGKHLALDNAAIQVGAGELAVILGANGAGKSSMLRALGGMLKPLPGAKVLLDGEDLLAVPPHHLVEKGLALVPEGRGVFVDLTVRENLQLGALTPRARPHEQENLANVLDLFPRLAERLPQRVGTMSGGEQQMVAVGRAIMSAPRYLLLDEPSLGLSPLMSQELFRAIKRVKEMGVGVLMVEQNVNLSLDIADRGYLIETGRIVGQGSANDLRNDPAVQQAYLGH
ncbi:MULTISPECIES: ABC transporter ATP-binding protein [Alcaligenaceae]|jgi:branched-chain amino acid transport system ATP-binding protein|uniref:ABC transporter ATP-binding protein n=1 Tax=Neopusillimonas maritima TaxID=2026239 RepID=A0A3A1YWN7_9BURK|nr:MULTISPECIES: ABC transporter ATP-binding protein [Alcaligenaceae]MAL01392.1 ABC transporter ATP-binding protein [Alcaligenaceae bacterium]QIM47805.1 ABC transporter ATP-binding protein [Pusillimonas sp. DMV24BSW_D]RII83115.1 ABC transporter ATP-binding protein [Neopusillimonas maritima]RIY41260.1 ABC transporter ATP-binding protein [Neopusillimonas maritima]